jgi:hypothetical protein
MNNNVNMTSLNLYSQSQSEDEMTDILGRSVNASTQLLRLSNDDALPSLDFLSLADDTIMSSGVRMSHEGVYGSRMGGGVSSQSNNRYRPDDGHISHWGGKLATAGAAMSIDPSNSVLVNNNNAPVVGGGVVSMFDGSWANNPATRNRMLAQANRGRGGASSGATSNRAMDSHINSLHSHENDSQWKHNT